MQVTCRNSRSMTTFCGPAGAICHINSRKTCIERLAHRSCFCANNFSCNYFFFRALQSIVSGRRNRLKKTKHFYQKVSKYCIFLFGFTLCFFFSYARHSVFFILLESLLVHVEPWKVSGKL